MSAAILNSLESGARTVGTWLDDPDHAALAGGVVGGVVSTVAVGNPLPGAAAGSAAGRFAQGALGGSSGPEKQASSESQAQRSDPSSRRLSSDFAVSGPFGYTFIVPAGTTIRFLPSLDRRAVNAWSNVWSGVPVWEE